jgi:dihydroorotase
VATDHAPHTVEEKQNPYHIAPSGGPLVQHALMSMLEHVKNKKISIERVVEKMAHNPAILFRIKDRGFIREGYYADLVVVDNFKSQKIINEDILYKCGWSPFEGETFSHSIDMTFVNGRIAYKNNKIIEGANGMRLRFNGNK